MNAAFIIFSALSITAVSLATPSFPKMNYSKEDLKSGRIIAQLLRNTRANKINPILARRMHRQINLTNSVFSPYEEWAKDILAISQINHIENFKPCATTIDKKYSDDLYKHLNKYCYLKFLHFYSRASDQTFKKYESLFTQYLPYYLFPFKNPFIQFLKNIKGKKNFNQMVTKKILSTYAEKSNHPVNAKLFPHILITADLTNYIQQTGLRDKSSKAFNQKRILALSRKIRSQEYLEKSSKTQLTADVQNLISIAKRESDIIDSSFARKLFIMTGRKLLSVDEYSLAKNCFEEALNLSTQPDYHDSLFLYLWPDILSQQYSQVNKVIDKLDLHGKFDELSSKLKFWIAYCSEVIGKKNLAEHYYNIIIQDNPISYYSIMSIKRLKAISKNIANLSIASSSQVIESNHPRENIPLQEYSQELLHSLKRIAIFTELGQTALIGHENHRINNTPLQRLLKNHTMYSKLSHNELREKITLHIAFILHQEENYLKSFSIIHNGLKIGKNNINPEILKTLFPTPYISQIENLVGPDIDPYIILSLIRQESAFNPKAKSRVGARGLMQLMPSTARQIERRLTSRTLHNPKTNLKVGIHYFVKLYNQYNKNLIYTLSAYNAGENRVKRWKKEYFKNHPTLYVIESIPFKETNLYVKLIFRNLFFYKLINGHKEDSEMANKIFDVFITKG